ncbi:G/U mismatch-specific DNA glycosylase [Isosphaeraceae bacterium EP7]
MERLGPWKPSKAEVAAAQDASVADVIGPGLSVVFCGINPSLYSAAVGRHFARPGNRFWPALHAAGFSDRRLSPWDQDEFLRMGFGITNIAGRATATAAELSADELVEGGQLLRERMERYRPRFLAVLGVTAYRGAFGRPKAVLGLQAERMGETGIWVLPNPSGLNAHYQLADLGRLYGEVRRAALG